MGNGRTVALALAAVGVGALLGGLTTGLFEARPATPPAEDPPTPPAPPPVTPPTVPPADAGTAAVPPPPVDEPAERRDGRATTGGKLRTASPFDEKLGGLDVMDLWAKDGADVTALMTGFEVMRRHVRVPEGPVAKFVSDGPTTVVNLSNVDPNAVVLDFGPGNFVLINGNSRWNVRRADVEAMEIRGAGIDRTTLSGPGWAFLCFDQTASLKNLVMRDLTLDSTNPGQIPLDARGSMSMALERVRFRGWEVAGHAAAIGVSGRAYIACKDCDFAGPGDGFAVSLRGGALALFETCRFTDMQGAFIGGGAASLGRPSVVTVRGSRFENARLSDRALSGEMQIEVRGGSVVGGGASLTEEEQRKKWGAEQATVVKDVSFGSIAPQFTMADLLRVLDASRGLGIQNVVRIDVAPGGRARPTVIDVYEWDRSAAKATLRSFGWATGKLTPLVGGEPRRNFFRDGLTTQEFDSCLPFMELVRRSGLAAGDSIKSAEIGRAATPTIDGVQTQTRLFELHDGQEPRGFTDAKTGRPLGKR